MQAMTYLEYQSHGFEKAPHLCCVYAFGNSRPGMSTRCDRERQTSHCRQSWNRFSFRGNFYGDMRVSYAGWPGETETQISFSCLPDIDPFTSLLVDAGVWRWLRVYDETMVCICCNCVGKLLLVQSLSSVYQAIFYEMILMIIGTSAGYSGRTLQWVKLYKCRTVEQDCAE